MWAKRPKHPGADAEHVFTVEPRIAKKSSKQRTCHCITRAHRQLVDVLHPNEQRQLSLHNNGPSMSLSKNWNCSATLSSKNRIWGTFTACAPTEAPIWEWSVVSRLQQRAAKAVLEAAPRLLTLVVGWTARSHLMSAERAMSWRSGALECRPNIARKVWKKKKPSPGSSGPPWRPAGESEDEDDADELCPGRQPWRPPPGMSTSCSAPVELCPRRKPSKICLSPSTTRNWNVNFSAQESTGLCALPPTVPPAAARDTSVAQGCPRGWSWTRRLPARQQETAYRRNGGRPPAVLPSAAQEHRACRWTTPTVQTRRADGREPPATGTWSTSIG